MKKSVAKNIQKVLLGERVSYKGNEIPAVIEMLGALNQEMEQDDSDGEKPDSGDST